MATINLCCAIILLLTSRCLCQEDVLLEISQGTLNGMVKYDRKGGPIYSFQSIPFGKPPIGNLRFKVRLCISFKHLTTIRTIF